MKNPQTIILDQIPKTARQIAQGLQGGEIFALIGPLGAGKTTFVKALGKHLKIKHNITSPSFGLMHMFPVKLNNKRQELALYHLDLYRTKSFREVKALGITEVWGTANTITLIEWADKIKKYLPKKTITINFTGHELNKAKK